MLWEKNILIEIKKMINGIKYAIFIKIILITSEKSNDKYLKIIKPRIKVFIPFKIENNKKVNKTSS